MQSNIGKHHSNSSPATYHRGGKSWGMASEDLTLKFKSRQTLAVWCLEVLHQYKPQLPYLQKGSILCPSGEELLVRAKWDMPVKHLWWCLGQGKDLGAYLLILQICTECLWGAGTVLGTGNTMVTKTQTPLMFCGSGSLVSFLPAYSHVHVD